MNETKEKVVNKADKKTDKKVPPKKVGLLHTGSSASFGQKGGPVERLKDALQPGGYIPANAEKYANGVFGNLAHLADDLIKDATLEVLVAAGGPESAIALRDALKKAGKTTPVVFTTVTDPTDMELVLSNTGPGGTNFTGMAGQTSEKDDDRLEVLSILAQFGKPPVIKAKGTIGVLVAGNRFHKDKQFDKVKDVAKKLDLEVKRSDKVDKKGIDDAFDIDFKRKVQGVVVMADSLFNNFRIDVVAKANAYPATPTIYQWKQFVDEGGLVSLGPDILDAYDKAGQSVQEILNGTNPAEMICTTPGEFIVHVKVPRAYEQLNLAEPDIPKKVILRDGTEYSVEKIP